MSNFKRNNEMTNVIFKSYNDAVRLKIFIYSPQNLLMLIVVHPNSKTMHLIGPHLSFLSFF